MKWIGIQSLLFLHSLAYFLCNNLCVSCWLNVHNSDEDLLKLMRKIKWVDSNRQKFDVFTAILFSGHNVCTPSDIHVFRNTISPWLAGSRGWSVPSHKVKPRNGGLGYLSLSHVSLRQITFASLNSFMNWVHAPSLPVLLWIDCTLPKMMLGLGSLTLLLLAPASPASPVSPMGMDQYQVWVVCFPCSVGGCR